MGKVSRRDLKLLARNTAKTMQEIDSKGFSLAVCFDVLVRELERRLPGFEAQFRKALEAKRNAVPKAMVTGEAEKSTGVIPVAVPIDLPGDGRRVE